MSEEVRTTIPLSKSWRNGAEKDEMGGGGESSYEDLPEDVKAFLEKRRSGSSGRDVLGLIQSKHMLSLIDYIDKHSPVIKTDIYANGSRCSNMNTKIQNLIDMGIIKVYNTAYTNTNVVVITEKGRRAAGIIHELVAVLDSD